ncbi:MAG: polyprenyl synthetase family protein [Clostridia bacterium]|nr:polyprenyl synthetase family protein [Clostridia bacterium]MCI2000933.1 polyprenyl synthetase family protein [Clostridia bacterium]MCI2015717.1 polyprenyl synthetase family protein [Clostridia bacterium]
MNFKSEMNEKKLYIDSELDRFIPAESEYPQIIFKAMRYSVFAGGKRVRPIILLASCELFGGDVDKAVPFACAMEMIHTYSLIHDDLPAIDNDNFRRGRLTNHKAFGENIAILAGDALLSHAFEVMSKAVADNPEPALAKAMYTIANGAGVNGMLTGQVVDVISDGKKLNKETLDFIHINKTAAMIQASFKAGAYIGGGTQEDAEKLSMAGCKIGMAFQIQDDILDVTGSFEELGKPVFSDERNQKTTYVTLIGLDKSKEKVKTLSDEAIDILKNYGDKAGFLIELTKKLIDRKK